MKALEEKILAEGQVFPGNILKVSSFLNHQLDVDFLMLMGEEIARLYKDTKIDKANTGVNGVLDYKHYGDILNRSWVFRTVGYGNGKEYWNDLISTLKAVGYDGIISIEHEDGLMSVKEGLEKAVSFMKDVLIYESAGEMWWA